MDQRKSDPRIYIITLLFLSCILTGGVLLGLYMLLSDPNPLFLQVGMFFVCVPWLFWFLAYLYSCVLKPCTLSVTNHVVDFDPEKAVNNNKILENATSPLDQAISPNEGEKHVQFGNVVVLGDQKGEGEGSSNNLIQDHMRIQEQENQESGGSSSRKPSGSK
ncbi:unnamed protein product [Cochlearia groenlandica]